MFDVIRQILYLLYQHNKITENTLQKFNWDIIITRIYIDDGNIGIKISPKTIRVNLAIKINKSLKFILSRIEPLAAYTIKIRIVKFC